MTTGNERKGHRRQSENENKRCCASFLLAPAPHEMRFYARQCRGQRDDPATADPAPLRAKRSSLAGPVKRPPTLLVGNVNISVVVPVVQTIELPP